MLVYNIHFRNFKRCGEKVVRQFSLKVPGFVKIHLLFLYFCKLVKHYKDSRKFNFVRDTILNVIDFFHPIFSRWIPLQTFRYLACGGGVTVLGLVVYFISYNYILHDELISFAGIHMTRYIAAYAISFLVSFPIGFFLSKFVVFQESHLKGRIQLFRYAALQGFNIILNYSLLHFFAGFCGFWATPSQTITTAILAVFSYFFQRHVSFRSKKPPVALHASMEQEESMG